MAMRGSMRCGLVVVAACVACVALLGCAGSSDDPGADPGGSGASGHGASGSGGAGGSGADGGAGGGASDPGPPCLPGGFCLEYPQLTDAELRGVHGSSAADIWSVGARGTALRSTDGGATWSRVDTGIEAALNAVFAVAPDDAWAVGDGGAALHWDGKWWKAVDVGTDADLRDVAVASDGTVWMVGGEDEGLIVAGAGDAFSSIGGGGCGWLGTLVLRNGSLPVAGGTTGSTACVTRVQGDEAVAEYVDPHLHDPSYAVIALLEAAGQLWGVVDGYNTTFVIGDNGGWSVLIDSLGSFADVAFKQSGGLWIAGDSIGTTTGESCAAAPGTTRAIWSTPDGTSVVAVGPGGLTVQVDPVGGCALARSYDALVNDSWIYTSDFARDAQGTPWFLVGATAWEYAGPSGWKAAFTVPDSYQGNYADYTTGFAACGDGSLRVVAQYYLGEDEYGSSVYQPIPYRWERGQGKASYDDVAIVIHEGQGEDEELFILEDVKCDATGQEWFAYRGLGSLYWAPRSAVSGKVPTTRPSCVTGWFHDESLSPGGSALFLSQGTVSYIEGEPTSYEPTFMAFEGDTCRLLTTSDWPALPGYVTAAADGTVQTGETDLVGGGVDDAWLAAPAAFQAAVAQGKVELAHLEAGAWKLVQIPLPAEVVADVKAAQDLYGSYFLSPRVTGAGGVLLVQVSGAETTYLLAVEGNDVQVVRGAGHSFGDLSHEGYAFAGKDALFTVEMPGTVYTRPL